MEKDKKAPTKEDTANLSEDALDALLEKRDFYKSNANAKDHRDEIEAMITASK
jgi:ribosomal protein L17